MNEEHSATQREVTLEPFARAARGCTAALVFAFAVLVVLFSFLGTIEMESFPGLRDNLAPLGPVSWIKCGARSPGLRR
ncbi:hypothetical protein [Actinacidiphila glaucinigra]|uniref:hypothetical protein n=1 Tax=Actinacidiphila glaucinigra TaxID=235986 RepID=UPI00366AE1E1